MMPRHKAAIETMINSAALALTSFGVLAITTKTFTAIEGYIAISFGICLEFIKYMGRYKGLW